MQKRAMSKDSFPGKYDTSSAGHIQAGDEPLASGLRELAEELGIHAKPEDLEFAGCIHGNFAEKFHGKIFRDNEIAFVYIYQQPVDIETLVLQKVEVESVRWFDLEETYQNCRNREHTVLCPCPGTRSCTAIPVQLKYTHAYPTSSHFLLRPVFPIMSR